MAPALQVKKQIELALERTQQIAQKQALKRESATQSLELARREKDVLTHERKAAHTQAKRLEEGRQGRWPRSSSRRLNTYAPVLDALLDLACRNPV